MNHELYEKLINDGILRKHNLKAYMKVVKEFEKSNRVGIVHATGTGKSFIALQLMYDNSDKKIKYLVPKTGIGDQIEEHINGLSENAREEYFKNVDILTYQKLINMSREEIKNLDIDYLIVDEFHHLKYAWKNAIDLLIETHPNIRIFGMTATSVRSRGTSKQEDVGETFFYGHIASTYTLAQAIADGVLMPPIYKGAVYMLEEKLNETQEKIRESNLTEEEKKEYLERIENAKKQVSNADSFSKMIRKNLKPNGKYIVFCPRGKREEYQLESEEWFKGFIEEENITRYFVDSKHPKESQINSDEFYNDHDTSKLRLMFAMDMYTEGIHVPDIDGIIMMRPTKSDIMFYQMLGRALASNKDKQTLVLDFVNNYEYIMKLKDYTKKELETRENNREYTYEKELKNIFEQFDIELENINVLNMLEKINKKVDLSYEQKIADYIELLNQGYVPKSKDKETKFSNGELINQFFGYNKDKIIKVLNTDPKYKEGYEMAHKMISDKSFDKIADYIELLNQGYVPKSIDKETKFSNGELINQFFWYNKDKIIKVLNTDPKYKEGYEIAHKTIKELINKKENALTFDQKIADYIELLNQGYAPKDKDKKTKFSNGELINSFWQNKDKIIERLKTDSKYKEGYEMAHKMISDKSFDKIADYIELLNQGYVPKNKDKETKFSNGEPINNFWGIKNNRTKVIEGLNTDSKYKEGYEIAHKTIKELMNKKENALTYEQKLEEYIELLNQGYVPRKKEEEVKFSNGEPINNFWSINRTKIKERLKTDSKYKEGYEIAHKTISDKSFDKIADYIELLNQGYVPKSIDKETKFSNGKLINYFFTDNKENIIERLNTDPKYKEGYEIAHKTIKELINKKENVLTYEQKLAEYIELLNQGYVPRRPEKEVKFSNGELINTFWDNKENIIERLNTDPKYKEGYDLAKKIVEITIIPKEEKNQKLKELKEYINNMNQDNMSSGGIKR
jgi:superfamily II DNA or RNA helicase